jgi:mannose-6-phosphate isomerase-like protein (cupin superfamily)
MRYDLSLTLHIKILGNNTMLDTFTTSHQEYLFKAEGCYITELSNTPLNPDISIARARVESGVTTTWHRLKNVTERYCILEGNGLVEIGNETPKNVSVGDVVIIPPTIRQRISNVGKTDLIF